MREETTDPLPLPLLGGHFYSHIRHEWVIEVFLGIFPLNLIWGGAAIGKEEFPKEVIFFRVIWWFGGLVIRVIYHHLWYKRNLCLT